MSHSRPRSASNFGEERWKSLRKAPSTITSGSSPLGHPDSSFTGRGRGIRQILSSTSTSLSIPLSPSFIRIYFCVRWGKVGSGKSGSHCHKASGKRKYLSHKSEGSKREDRKKNFEKEAEHSYNDSPFKSDSDRAAGQRTRKNFPHEGGNPRPIAG